MGCKLCTLNPEDVAGGEGDTSPQLTKHHEDVVDLIIRSRRHDLILNEAMKSFSGISPEDVHANLNPSMEKETRDLLYYALKSHVLFSNLSDADIYRIVDVMEPEEFSRDEVVFEQHAEGDKFFVVEKGTFDIFMNEECVHTVVAGSHFGELALLRNCPRAATVKCANQTESTTASRLASQTSSSSRTSSSRTISLSRITGRAEPNKAKLYSLNRPIFRKIIAQNAALSYQKNMTLLKQVKLLEQLTPAQMAIVAEASHSMEFQAGDIIIRKGTPGTIFYMIQEGKVTCTDIGDGKQQDVELVSGEYFGERALLNDEPRAASVIAATRVKLLVLDRKTFDNVVGPLEHILKENLILQGLKSVPILSDLPTSNKLQLVSAVQTKTYSAGDYVVNHSETDQDFFYIIKSGQATIRDQFGLESVEGDALNEGDYFGERILLDPDDHTEDVIAQTDVECYVITPQDFFSILQPIIPRIQNNLKGRKDHGEDKLFGKSIQLSDLEFISYLGAGTFGIVKLVRHLPSNRILAIKEMWKASIEASRQKEHVISEKQVSTKIQSRFACRCLAAFQDETKIYMLSEPYLGGELFSRFVSSSGVAKPLNIQAVKFYAACVLLAIESLHKLSIVYRDLKPENILLDARGYAHIADFGFAKKIQSRTFTLCGTPEYVAPEIILGTGHGLAVDYWALGILIYEMYVGKSPFADKHDDQMAIFKNILNVKVDFKKSVVCKEWQEVVQHLLERNPSKRLGHVKFGCSDLREHAFFHNFAFRDLEKAQMTAPWIPSLESDTDVHYLPSVEEEIISENERWKDRLPQTDWGNF